MSTRRPRMPLRLLPAGHAAMALAPLLAAVAAWSPGCGDDALPPGENGAQTPQSGYAAKCSAACSVPGIERTSCSATTVRACQAECEVRLQGLRAECATCLAGYVRVFGSLSCVYNYDCDYPAECEYGWCGGYTSCGYSVPPVNQYECKDYCAAG